MPTTTMKKKLSPYAVELSVKRWSSPAEAEEARADRCLMAPIDADGHEVAYATDSMPVNCTCTAKVYLRKGTTPAAAGIILRKLARLIESNGDLLADCHEERFGCFDESGVAVDDDF